MSFSSCFINDIARKLQKTKARDEEEESSEDELEKQARQIAIERQKQKDIERTGQSRPVSTSGSARHGPPPTGM